MQEICDQLSLEYDPGFLERWHQNVCITGDNKNSSRGSTGDLSNQIRPLPRREVDAVLANQLKQDNNYQEIVRLLGYT
jgi:hypothetical protein